MAERVLDRHGDTWTRTGRCDRLWRRDESPHLVLDVHALQYRYGPLSSSHLTTCMCVGCCRRRDEGTHR